MEETQSLTSLLLNGCHPTANFMQLLYPAGFYNQHDRHLSRSLHLKARTGSASVHIPSLVNLTFLWLSGLSNQNKRNISHSNGLPLQTFTERKSLQIPSLVDFTYYLYLPGFSGNNNRNLSLGKQLPVPNAFQASWDNRTQLVTFRQLAKRIEIGNVSVRVC